MMLKMTHISNLYHVISSPPS